VTKRNIRNLAKWTNPIGAPTVFGTGNRHPVTSGATRNVGWTKRKTGPSNSFNTSENGNKGEIDDRSEIMKAGTLIKKRKELGPWQISALLLMLYLGSECGTYLIGGDRGAFLYVTTHFVVMPLISLGAIVVIAILSARTSTPGKRLLLLSSVVIPVAIIAIAATGHPGLSRLFGSF
jgi:hypothetical protein